MDDGWAAAPDWPVRIADADAALDRAERAGRPAALLTTARSGQDAAPALSPIMPVGELRPRLAALHPLPWPPDRAAAAAALAGTRGSVIYIADGLAAPGDEALAAAMAQVGPIDGTRAAVPRADLMLAAARGGGPAGRARRAAAGAAPPTWPCWRRAATAARWRAWRRTCRPAPPTAELPIALPPELRNRLTRLQLEGPASAGRHAAAGRGASPPAGRPGDGGGRGGHAARRRAVLPGAGAGRRSPSCAGATCTRCCSGRSRCSCWPTGR